MSDRGIGRTDPVTYPTRTCRCGHPFSWHHALGAQKGRCLFCECKSPVDGVAQEGGPTLGEALQWIRKFEQLSGDAARLVYLNHFLEKYGPPVLNEQVRRLRAEAERLNWLAYSPIGTLYKDDSERLKTLLLLAEDLQVFVWRPIETVPKGVEVLLWWIPRDGNPYAEGCITGSISVHEPGKWWNGHSGTYQEIDRVTHWMPLPGRPGANTHGMGENK